MLLHHSWLVFDDTHQYSITPHKSIDWHSYMHDYISSTIVWHGDNKQQVWMRSEIQFLQFDCSHHHTSPTTHTHQPTHMHMSIYHLFIIVAVYSMTDTLIQHAQQAWMRGRIIFFVHRSDAVTPHIKPAAHTNQHQHMCQHITHTWQQQHAGWVTPSSNIHNSTGDTIFLLAVPDTIIFAAQSYNQCCSSIHQHTHIATALLMTCTPASSSHNVFHSSTVTHQIFLFYFQLPSSNSLLPHSHLSLTGPHTTQHHFSSHYTCTPINTASFTGAPHPLFRCPDCEIMIPQIQPFAVICCRG